jgi:hypothetical protein
MVTHTVRYIAGLASQSNACMSLRFDATTQHEPAHCCRPRPRPLFIDALSSCETKRNPRPKQRGHIEKQSYYDYPRPVDLWYMVLSLLHARITEATLLSQPRAYSVEDEPGSFVNFSTRVRVASNSRQRSHDGAETSKQSGSAHCSQGFVHGASEKREAGGKA